jgi:hypothetical protein
MSGCGFTVYKCRHLKGVEIFNNENGILLCIKVSESTPEYSVNCTINKIGMITLTIFVDDVFTDEVVFDISEHVKDLSSVKHSFYSYERFTTMVYIEKNLRSLFNENNRIQNFVTAVD